MIAHILNYNILNCIILRLILETYNGETNWKYYLHLVIKQANKQYIDTFNKIYILMKSITTNIKIYHHIFDQKLIIKIMNIKIDNNQSSTNRTSRLFCSSSTDKRPVSLIKSQLSVICHLSH